ncbi:MAG: hypothetical protein WD672_09025 [Woeseia sp.]
MLIVLLFLIAACGPGERPTAPPSPAIVAVDIPSRAGSLGPNLAKTGDGRAVLSWMEPDGSGYALKYAIRDGSRWTDPVTVSRGENWFVNWADFPSVVPIDGDFWAAHWLVRRPAGGYAYDIHVAISNDGGQSWTGGERPHRDDTDSEHGFVTIFPDAGYAGLVWLDGRRTVSSGDDTMRSMTLRAARLSRDQALSGQTELDTMICDCCQTDVAVTPDGPVAVYRDRSESEIRDIYSVHRDDDQWLAGEAVAQDGWKIAGCPVNGPVVASHDDDIAVAWFTAADDVPRVRLARSRISQRSFSMPVDVAGVDTIGRVGLLLMEDGKAIVSSLRSNGDGAADLLLTPVSASGRVGAATTLATGVAAYSVPQIIRQGDELLAVWTERRGERSVLAGARLPLAAL